MLSARRLALWLLMLSGCATAPSPPRPATPPLPITRTTPRVPLQRVSAETPGNPSAVIGKRDLDEARELLNRARNELEPRQWALLDARLTEAEQAFESFSKAANAAGRAAEVARGAEAAAKVGRAGETIEGIGTIARTGPLLVVLGLLWPSKTADTAHDHGPDWNPAEQEFKEKLWALAQAGQQVKSELAARTTPAPVTLKPESMEPEREPEQASRRSPDKPPPSPQVRVRPDWRPSKTDPNAPRYRPCGFFGQGGPGPFRPEQAPLDWIRCTYICARYEVVLYVRQRRDANGKLMNAQAICEEWVNLKRAEEHARTKDDALKKQGD